MNNSFLMTNSPVLGIMQSCARVAERQTRRSQKPLSKDVRVQIPPRAPLHMIKACFQQAFFCFPHFFDAPTRDTGKCTSGQFGRQSRFGTSKTIMRLDLQLFCFCDGRTNLMGRSAQRVSPHSSHSYRTSRSQQGHTNAGAKGKVLLFFANSQTKARAIPINATNRT